MKELISVNKELIPLVDDEGNSALHLACIKGYVNVAKVLIERGAAVDVRCVCLCVCVRAQTRYDQVVRAPAC